MEGRKKILLSASRSEFVAIGTANILKIGQQITFFWPNRDFALAREIIHDNIFSFFAILLSDLNIML